MKIVLLCANIKDEILLSIKETIAKVFLELEVEVEEINLEILPYFTGEKSIVSDQIFKEIENCNGLIAFSNIYITGIHGSMQTFFNYVTVYQEIILNKPMLAITYSKIWGETEAAHLISKFWRFLGGTDINPIALNAYLSREDALKIIERQLENYYRQLNQGISNIISTERMLFLNRNNTNDFTLSGTLKTENLNSAKKPLSLYNTTEEKEIAEITNLLKEKISDDDTFTPLKTGTYQKPPITKVYKKIASLPHYFIAHHDKSFSTIIQYIINDTKEAGFIIIKGGDCIYEDGITDNYNVEISMIDSVFDELITKSLSYQKAFMVGRIKVKGNFAILPKLDQIFRSSREYN
ncbi:hypothetical protein AN641_01850 [Candidatus Epulonipiscioides gigas]|nr:hypothetical protein AN641_01850 [Epulopiscium sp. SCG-C07WGA-EpuloA2]